MTRRKTYQQGSLSFQSGKLSTFRIREFDHKSGEWIQRRFQLGKFKDDKDAQKAAQKIRAEINERNNTNPKKLYARVTFKEFIETYWRDYTVREQLAVSTLNLYQSYLDVHLLPELGDKKMCEINPVDIDNVLQSLYVAGYALNTIRSLYAFLRSVFSLAKQRDVIKKSPVRSKRHRPKPCKVDKPTLRGAQIGELIRRLPNKQEQLFALLVALTALRVGEALALRWMDFNAAEGQLTISHTLYRNQVKKTKTEGSVATLQLDAVLTSLLLAHWRESDFREPLDFIFCRADGQPLCYRTCREHLHWAMDEVGIERQPHKHGYHLLRHSAATLLHKKSRDLKAVQSLLRHADISTTANIYIHPDGKFVSEGIEALAEEILPNCDLVVTEKSGMVN